ncbi:SDR family NAD(P)-dependent oxidoreductase [Salinarimonas ramus]|uniref:Short-chain dehydrogenase n=1 Tax=Salinarimonas ramus TaxID=690164 RepID=A0A917Q406_9HYPH|nr:SDR family oxidoreductase [Salinarimonas ramus]GGK20655.1 short-chain dehydrogenase [Salinarimonas ramus]
MSQERRGADEAPERVVVVTGAASGIGAATARRLAGPGVALVLNTRANADGLANVAAEARDAGAAVETVLADLTETGACAEIVARARARFGRVDQIVSNAGRAKKSVFGDFAAGDVAEAVAVNALPFASLVTAALDDLAGSPWGRVVAVSSFVAHAFGVNDTLFPTTAAGKGALEALARSLAFQLAPTGTTVNCVAPGFTRKVGGHSALQEGAWDAAARATPMGRIAEPDDVAAAIVFLLSREARHVTGQILRVDGGLSLR